MKISNVEYGKASINQPGKEEKILPKDMPRKGALTAPGKPQTTPLEQGLQVVEAALRMVPECREDIVSELKAKILRGEYKVAGDDIAEMMMRRRAADRIR